jgi:hypothetical protein
MEYELNIITRDQIPNNIYLCQNTKDKDWYMIHLVEFYNGLKCVQGSYYPQQAKDIIENIKDEMDYIINTNSPDELQEYFYDNFNNFINYKNCVKIWNYYHNNKNLIEEVYGSYFNEENELISDYHLEYDSQSDSLSVHNYDSDVDEGFCN